MTEIQKDSFHKETLIKHLELMQKAHHQNPMPSLEKRKERLQRLLRGFQVREDAFIESISKDFGNRSVFETANYDITTTLGDIKNQIRNVATWMRPRKRTVPMYLLPGRARILPQPLGIVGVISPWNFPLILSLGPVAGALAAGNRVMLKPSELTPRTSKLLAQMAKECFEKDEFFVMEGGVEVGQSFSELPFDHLLFTGSQEVARTVAKAAADNLTPTTLELGGKSPAIICPGADLKRSANRVAFGKLANAGQICIAPDYVLVERSRFHDFVEHLQAEARKAYPELGKNPYYTSIISDHHYSRLNEMIEEAHEKGTEVITINPAGEDFTSEKRKIPLTLILLPDVSLKVMQEEIFGPILPILSYERLEDAIDFVQRRPHPLGLYIFTESSQEREEVLRQTISGGVSVNEVFYHFVCNTIPFGGIGSSGMGAYHGQAGFDTFSHLKPIFIQSRLNFDFFMMPPVTTLKQFIGHIFRKLV